MLCLIGSTREKESTSPKITEYFKAEEPSVALKKEKEETAVTERSVKVVSGVEEGELCTEVEKGKVEQSDSVELKPRAKVIKNDDTSSSHKPPAPTSSKSVAKVSQPLTKTLVHVDKTTKPKVTGNASKATGRRKREKATTGTPDSDFAPNG
jgi:hypothetical protein